jgi:hypothetical protein
MKRRQFFIRIIVPAVSILILAVIMAFAMLKPYSGASTDEEYYTQMLKDEKYDELAEQLRSAYAGSEFDDMLAGVVQAVAKNATPGMRFIDRLHEHNDLITKSLEAELLMKTASGVDMKPWELKRMAGQFDLVTTGQIAERAVRLMEHDDPFVRGLAEFAISIRVGLENSESLKEFPGKEKPEWYKTWEKGIEGDQAIGLDYTRQASERGIHRTAKALAEEAPKVVERADNVYRQIREYGNEIQQKTAEKAFQQLKKAAADLHAARNLTEARKKYIELRYQARELIMQNPDFDFDQTVFALHHAFHDFGNITNGGKSFVIKPGGDLFIKHGFSPSGALTPLLDGRLGPGHSRGIELHFNADRMVFSFALQPRYYEVELWESDQGFDDKVHGMSEPNHIYEINLQNKEIVQLTSSTLHIDIEPTYLPNGDIVFSSDRGEFGSQCSGNYFQNKRIVNQYRMKGDGSEVWALSNNKDFDRYNHVLDNGELVFTRWEYQERHLYQTHNLWKSRPDGSIADALYKQHVNSLSPMSLRDARQISGTDKLVAVGAGHHEWEQGAVMVIDPRIGTNDPDGMTIITPHISKREGGIGKGKIPVGGGVPDNGGLYQQPFALSESSFLVSFSYNYPRPYTHGFNFALYYIDVFGNKELIHRDPVLSVYYGTPLKKRPTPPVISDAPDTGKNYAEVYVTNVYQGMEGVEQGEIKFIRVGHHTEWPAKQISDNPHQYNHYHYQPSGAWSRTVGMWTWSPARVIGVVPVEEDGSAYFKVPSNTPVYFQALDENMLEVRRMRTFVSLNKGETRGCTGCHETRDEAPMALDYVPVALLKEAFQPEPPSWGDTILPDYEEHIHPIFAKNCSGCHGAGEPAAGLEFSSRRVDGYYQAYRTLFGLKAQDPTPVQELNAFELTFGEDYNVVADKESLQKMERNEYPGQLISLSNKFSDNSVTRVREFGSSQSKLIQALLSDSHREKIELSTGEWKDLVTWIDLNAPYWGSFVDKEPVRDGGKPIRVKVTFDNPFAER